jgi:tRNA threonylcarbamoyl adenosine modification protein YeaZ
VILVIDTSSATAAVALIDPDTGVLKEMYTPSRSDLLPLLRQTARLEPVTKVAVATGPGSFTGLRVGVSFGLGLAMGRRIPIIPLPSLDLQAARSDVPATAVLEAGRGRVYYKVPGRKPMLGGPDEVPTSHPLVGSVAPVTESALLAAGHRFVQAQPGSWGRAAARLLKKAREVAYGSLEIEYMQTFSIPKTAKA